MLIIGGGIAGLWSAAVLAKKGYAVLLVERDALGGGQTNASQGILHGGIKYTLGGKATQAAKAVAEMPARWQAAMTNAPGSDLDLRSIKTLCPAQYLWTTGSLFGRMTAKVAAAAIRTAVRLVEPTSACAGLAAAPRSTSIYQVDEPVIDPLSAVEALRNQLQSHGGVIAKGEPRLRCGPGEQVLELEGLTVSFSTLVLAGGAGNHMLLQHLRAATPQMQRRPLHMVIVRSGRRPLPELYGHCIAALSDKPRLTITTHAGSDGGVAWYIGGSIAETGIERSHRDQVAAARKEVHECLPWIDLGDAQWGTLRIDRAEGRTSNGSRPDLPVIAPVAGSEAFAIALWPTKLVFAPLVADRVADWVTSHLMPSRGGPYRNRLTAVSDEFTPPAIAPRPVDRGDAVWS